MLTLQNCFFQEKWRQLDVQYSQSACAAHSLAVTAPMGLFGLSDLQFAATHGDCAVQQRRRVLFLCTCVRGSVLLAARVLLHAEVSTS